jgi:hypothetical protein
MGSVKMGMTWRLDVETRYAYRIPMGNPHGKRPLVRERRRWDYNTMIDLGKIACEDRTFC